MTRVLRKCSLQESDGVLEKKRLQLPPYQGRQLLYHFLTYVAATLGITLNRLYPLVQHLFTHVLTRPSLVQSTVAYHIISPSILQHTALPSHA